MNQLFTATVNKDLMWEMNHFHFHDLYEILFVTAGTCSFLIEKEMIQATRGTILLMKSGLLHMSTSLPDSEYTRYVINFNPADIKSYSSGQTDLLRYFLTDKHHIQLTETEIVEIEPLFRACDSQSAAYGNDIRRNLSFLELLIRIGELMMQDRAPMVVEESENQKNYTRIKPILEYILEHPSENLGLETVAEKFYYNKHYLCRIFKTATGISVGKYITSVRIQQAALLLREGYSVQEIGKCSGFKNNSNFISTFRKVMDISPGQYRQYFRQTFRL